MPELKGCVFVRFSGAKMVILHNERSAIGTPDRRVARGAFAKVCFDPYSFVCRRMKRIPKIETFVPINSTILKIVLKSALFACIMVLYWGSFAKMQTSPCCMRCDGVP